MQPQHSIMSLGIPSVQPVGATGEYQAFVGCGIVTPTTIPNSGPLLATGVWIAYMKQNNTTFNGTSDFVEDQNYIELNRDDMAGAKPIDSNLATYTPVGGQTATIPDGKVDFHDITYFVSAYINYYTNNIYNPYADMNADGNINFHDLSEFVSTYIAYYVNYI